MQEKNESFTADISVSIRDSVDQHLYTGFDFSSKDPKYFMKVMDHFYRGKYVDDENNIALQMKSNGFICPMIWNLEVISNAPIQLSYNGQPFPFTSPLRTTKDDVPLVNSVYDENTQKYRTSFDGIALFFPKYSRIGFSGSTLEQFEMTGRMIDVYDAQNYMYYTNGKTVCVIHYMDGYVGLPVIEETTRILEYIMPQVLRKMIDIYMLKKYTFEGRDEIFRRRYHPHFISLFFAEIKGLHFINICRIYDRLKHQYGYAHSYVWV